MVLRVYRGQRSFPSVEGLKGLLLFVDCRCSCRLEARGEYERAAAVALFNGKIRAAINILSSDENPTGEKMMKRPAKGENSVQFLLGPAKQELISHTFVEHQKNKL